MNNVHIINQCRIFALSLALIFCSSSAFSINKCTVSGNVSYSDLPCPKEAHSTPFTQQVAPPNDPEAAKQRYLSDQKKLRIVTQQKIKEEKQHQRDVQVTARQVRKEESQKFKCNELDLKRKSARRHQSDVQFKRDSRATDRARLYVKQTENNYVRYCKS